VSNAGQSFSLAQAAVVCQVSRKTLMRRAELLKEGGSYKDSTGGWVIPLGALLHAGLTPGRPATPDSPPRDSRDAAGVGQDSRDTQIARLQDEIERLRLAADEAVELRRRAEVAEALASERERVIAAQRQTLRMLEAGATASAREEDPGLEARSPAPLAAKGRGWFRRRAFVG